MRGILRLSRYPSPVLFLAMSLCAAVVAWMSVELLHMAMANAEYLFTYRVMALQDGGLLQAAELALRGLIAMAAYLGFKGCEVELVARWRGKEK